MSRILKVSQSDYRIQVKDTNGRIYLDVGSATSGGRVVITGDLEVQGETTTINTTEMTVEDRVITLNSGEQGTGISLRDSVRQSGIEIDRGQADNSSFIFDEDINWYSGVALSIVGGAFALKTGNDSSALQLSTIVTGAGSNNFVFDMQAGLGTLRIANSTNYYQRVTNDNDIPNWKTVTNYVAAQNGVATVDRLFYPATATFGNEDSKIQAFASNINMYIAGDIIATISPTGLSVNNINLFENAITNTSLTDDLSLSAITNQVVVDGVLNLTDQALTPVSVSGKNKLYSGNSVGSGGTGLYFTNTTKSSELVSKERAVLLSILL